MEIAVRDIVAEYVGADPTWADALLGMGLGPQEVRTYLDTAKRVPGSMLSVGADRKLCERLQEYAAERGLSLPDKDEVPGVDGKVRYRVRAMLLSAEREALVREARGMARLEFSPVAGQCYFDHGVATVLNRLSRRWLRSQVPRGGTLLEVGANVEAALLAAEDPACYVGYTPVLGVRDAGRHAGGSLPQRAVRGHGGFSEAQRAACAAYLEDPSRFFRSVRIEDDDTPGEYIISCHADYDIDLDDVPGIMARHGARAWFGVLTLPEGFGVGENSDEGEVPGIGARYVVDRESDKVSFHFRGSSAFAYHHRLSSLMKRAVRRDYRWHCGDYDYVYTRLPASAGSTLCYAVYRVRRVVAGFLEPTYVATGRAGFSRVKSVRLYAVAGRWKVSPIEFDVEKLVLDKVIEYRRQFGAKGNVTDVMYFLGSVRVRFFLNGTYVGAEHPLRSDLFSAVAVFVEAYHSLTRQGDAYDLRRINEAFLAAIEERTLLGQVAHWLSTLAGSVAAPAKHRVRAWREALERLVASVHDFEFSVRDCPAVELLDGGQVGDALAERRDPVGCPCRELRDVMDALASVEEYTPAEVDALKEYEARLRSQLPDCRCAWRAERTDFLESVSSDSSTCVGSSECGEDYFEDAREFSRREAMEEFAELMLFQKRAVDSESIRDASLVFADGTPSEKRLAHYNTTRRKCGIVRVCDGRLVEVRGPVPVSEIGALVDVNAWIVVPTRSPCRGGRVDVVGVDDGWHFTSTLLCVYNRQQVAAATRAVMADEGAVMRTERVAVEFVSGPFGCGKTRKLVQYLVDDLRAGVDVVYVSATRGSMEQVASALAERGFSDARCATMDSLLMNKTWRANRVYIDEGPMAHYGQLLACITKLGAGEVAVFGDFEQIPFCSFTDEFPTPCARMDHDIVRAGEMNVLHRCRLEVLAMWDEKYGGRLVPCECCPHVRESGVYTEVVKITGVSQVPVEPGVRYLVHTQAAREKLREHIGAGASVEVLRGQKNGGLATIHEDQGGTYDNVIVVRTEEFFDKSESKASPAIYNRVPYTLTGTTRGKYSLRYYTTSLERDGVIRAIESVTEEKKAELLARSPAGASWINLSFKPQEKF